MFKAVPMVYLQAIILAQDERNVLKGLGELGAVHLTRTPSDVESITLTPTAWSNEFARYESLRSHIQEFRQLLEIPSVTHELLPQEMTLEEAEEGFRLLEEKGREPLEKRQRLIQRQKELSAQYDRISLYRGFDIPLTGLDQFSFLHFVTGNVPQQNVEVLLKRAGDNAALIPLSQHKGQQSIFAITTRDTWPVLEKQLQQAGFQHEMLPVMEGATVDTLLGDIEKEQNELSAELEAVNNTLRTIAVECALPLSQIETSIETEYRLLDARQKFSRTDATVMITGWIPADDVGALEDRVKEITGSRYILHTTSPDASTEDQVPVLLRHPRLLRPFEMLVSAYGLPTYREMEPTLFVALSYIVMFGMMFGDAGHGLVLALCGVLALSIGRSQKVRDFGILLLFAGISSIIFGIVYGSYFGIEELKKYAIWHDPLECDPMRLMYGAIGIGIVLISIGLILNVINHFQRGDLVGGLFDKFGLVGLLFYWGTLVLLIKGAAIQARGLMGVCIVLFLIIPLVGWAIKEPQEHLLKHRAGEHEEGGGGFLSAFMESCVEAFEAILSYLANTISFVRLAAYAMSHAALLFAAFMLAHVVKDFPYGWSIWSLVIIIIGNLIAIVLEGIIASVQALRLEYYEFFGKFFSGSGRPFEPFRLASGGKKQET